MRPIRSCKSSPKQSFGAIGKPTIAGKKALKRAGFTLARLQGLVFAENLPALAAMDVMADHFRSVRNEAGRELGQLVAVARVSFRRSMRPFAPKRQVMISRRVPRKFEQIGQNAKRVPGRARRRVRRER